MSAQPADSLSIIVERPDRRSRSEMILRDLLSTSYSHNLLSNLVIFLAKEVGYTDEELQATAEVFKAAENEYNLLDFVRCIEIRKLDDTIQLVMKSLKIDIEMPRIDDDRKNHEYMARGVVELPSATYVLPNPSLFSEKLLKAFYGTQVRHRQTGQSLQKSVWVCREKKGVSTPSGGGAFSYNDQNVSFEQAIEILNESLQLPKFQILLTHNTILLQDQKKRLWGQNFSAPRK